jgi:hypothetical protein
LGCRLGFVVADVDPVVDDWQPTAPAVITVANPAASNRRPISPMVMVVPQQVRK